MKEYVSPNATIVTFDKENVIITSGCNCYADVRVNDMDAENSECYADTYGAEELTLHDQMLG